MVKVKDYLLDKPVAFQEIKVYVGGLKEELIRSTRYYMYVCYGKHWRDGDRFYSIEFLIRSVKVARNSHNNFARDIKLNKRLYQAALDELLTLLNDSKPLQTDAYSLNLLIGFHADMERAINTIMRSKETFKN